MNNYNPTIQGGRPRIVHQRPPFVLGQKGRPVGAGVAKNTIGVNSSLSGKIGGSEENENQYHQQVNDEVDADFSPPAAKPDFVADGGDDAKMKNDAVFPSSHNDVDDEDDVNHANEDEPNFTTERRDSCRRSLKFFAGTKEILNPNSEDRNSSVNEDFVGNATVCLGLERCSSLSCGVVEVAITTYKQELCCMNPKSSSYTTLVTSQKAGFLWGVDMIKKEKVIFSQNQHL